LSLFLAYTPGIAIPALATAVGLGGAVLGLWLTGMRRRVRVVVPFSAGVLLGVALFGLLPELALEFGWTASVLLFAAGYGLLFAVNRFAYPVCPSCAHDHDHNSCSTELHGFAGPLIVAAALHSFLDGWSVATAQLAVPLGLRVAVPLAVGLHKLPEGIALAAPGLYRFGGQAVELTTDHRVVLAGQDRLAGSALRMDRGLANAVKLAGVTLPEAVRMATVNAARAGNVPERQQGLFAGDRADLVQFRWDPAARNIEVVSTWISGRLVYKR
jgi:hypothetical protein